MLADVSGKAVPAALLMSNLEALFRSHCKLGLSEAPSLLAVINRLFYDVTGAERYASLFFARYDDDSRHLCYINCGHPPPFIFQTDGVSADNLGDRLLRRPPSFDREATGA